MTTTTQRRPLSPGQLRVLRSMCTFVREWHRQPSYRELGDLLGLKSVQHEIDQLEAKGWIRRGGAGSARAIEFAEDVFEEITGAATAAPSQETGETP